MWNAYGKSYTDPLITLSTDFLAVVDLNKASPTYKQVGGVGGRVGGKGVVARTPELPTVRVGLCCHVALLLRTGHGHQRACLSLAGMLMCMLCAADCAVLMN